VTALEMALPKVAFIGTGGDRANLPDVLKREDSDAR